MALPATHDYVTLVRQFVQNKMPAPEFEHRYSTLFKSDEGLHPDGMFAILDALSGDVDAYNGDKTTRDAQDIDEVQLHQRAEAALEALDRLS